MFLNERDQFDSLYPFHLEGRIPIPFAQHPFREVVKLHSPRLLHRPQRFTDVLVARFLMIDKTREALNSPLLVS